MVVNLAIIGSRSFNNYLYAKRKILDVIESNDIQVYKIISGGANGADKIAEMFSNDYNIPIEIIHPDWSIGRHAGLKRNTDIINKSDYVIAFWDGISKGTLDSIGKAKRLKKRIFIFNISPEKINDGIRLNDDGTYMFDFANDKKSDLLTLKYNSNYIISKNKNGIISYSAYKSNKSVDDKIRFALLKYIKRELPKTDKYEHMLNKAVLGLLNNPNINISDVDLILIPQSESNINLNIANKIKNKVPNALFLKDVILKNQPENVTINYELLKSKNVLPETIIKIEQMVSNAVVEGVFKIKKIHPKFRKYILNFLTIDVTNRKLINKLMNGKVLVIDDIITEGTTFKEINRLIENYAPREIILFSLVS